MKRYISETRYFNFDGPRPLASYVLRRAAYYFVAPYYKVKLNVLKPKKGTRKKYYVSICAIFRDESPYLKQWIDFHILAGVDHFYLYNNYSEDDFLSVLEPYIKKGVVTLNEWPVPQGQMAAYQDCFDKHRDETQWFVFIDLDEYIIPNTVDSIGTFLKKFERNRPSVIVYWKYMTSSGLITRDPSGYIIEDFIVGHNKYANIGKVFFNTMYDYIPDFKKNNYMHLMWGGNSGMIFPPVNCFNKICIFGIDRAKKGTPPIQINHYLLKSYDEYRARKIKRGGGVHAEGFHTEGYFWSHDMRCCEIDVHAYKYLTRLKALSERQDNYRNS